MLKGTPGLGSQPPETSTPLPQMVSGLLGTHDAPSPRDLLMRTQSKGEKWSHQQGGVSATSRNPFPS